MLGGHRSNCRASEVGRTTASDASIGQPTAINTYLTYQCFHSSQWHPPCTVGVPPLHPRPLTQWSLRKGKKDTHTHTPDTRASQPAKAWLPRIQEPSPLRGLPPPIIGSPGPPLPASYLPKGFMHGAFFCCLPHRLHTELPQKGKGKEKNNHACLRQST